MLVTFWEIALVTFLKWLPPHFSHLELVTPLCPPSRGETIRSPFLKSILLKKSIHYPLNELVFTSPLEGGPRGVTLHNNTFIEN